MLSRLRYIDTSRLNKFLRIDVSGLYIWNKQSVAFNLFQIGLILNVFASIHVSLLWLIEPYIYLLTAPLFFMSILLSRSSSRGIFTRTDFLLPMLLCLIVQYYQSMVNSLNIVPYILTTSSVLLYYSVFSIDSSLAQKATNSICRWFAAFLIVSMAAFFLVLIGINLPGYYVVHGNYSYTNYFLFLLDDRDIFTIIPRFHSVFLEPGHMGTTIVMLLATQIGQWKRWYNVVMIVAAVLSFSLAAYCLGVMLLFLRLWLMRRKIVLKAALLIGIIAGIVGGSFVYNDGDNMLNQLIVMRLEMSDTGDDFEGNNRVSEDFEKEFESYLTSSDVFFGKEMDYEIWGNSGYRVYIFDFGIVGLMLFLTFYFVAFKSGHDKRAICVTFVLAMTNFWIRGYPMIFAFLLPYFITSQLDIYKTLTDPLTDPLPASPRGRSRK